MHSACAQQSREQKEQPGASFGEPRSVDQDMEARYGQTVGQFPVPMALCWQRVEELSPNSTAFIQVSPTTERPSCLSWRKCQLAFYGATPLMAKNGGKAGKNGLATPTYAWCKGPSLDFSVGLPSTLFLVSLGPYQNPKWCSVCAAHLGRSLRIASCPVFISFH